MDLVNDWLGLALTVIGVLAGVAAMMRWMLGSLDARIDAKLDSKLAPIHSRLDALDTKIDHVAEVVDLRLRPLEADMALVKQHLLGTPAA